MSAGCRLLFVFMLLNFYYLFVNRPSILALNVGSYYLSSSPWAQQQQSPALNQQHSSSTVQRQRPLPINEAPLTPDSGQITTLRVPSLFPHELRPQTRQSTLTSADVLSPSDVTSAPIVRTTSGRLAGHLTRANDGALVALYLGVPFAKPPVGELRFRKPEHFIAPPHTIINASSYAPLCGAIKIVPKNRNNVSSSFRSKEKLNVDTLTEKESSNEVRVSEDCLYLNVYVPASVWETAANNGAKVPVTVSSTQVDFAPVT